MKKPRGPIYQYMFYALMVFEAIFILLIVLQKNVNSAFQHEILYSMNDNWTLQMDNGDVQSLTIPAVLDAGKDHSITISHILPDNSQYITSVGILTTHQNIAAYIDGRPIYSRIAPIDQYHFFNIPPGSVWDIIPLAPDSNGKTLTLVLSSKYPNYAGRVNEVHVGTKASILLHTIDSFVFGFFLSALIFVMGSFLIFLYYITKKLLKVDKSVYYLGLFFVISGIWLLMESNLIQLFLLNSYITSTISYLSLMTFPLPILLYVKHLEGYHYKLLNSRLIYSLLFTDFLIFLLQFLNIRDFCETLPELRILLFIILGVALITLWLEFIMFKNKKVKVFMVAASTLFTFSVIELFMYQMQSEKANGGFFRIGLYLFLFILGWDGIKTIVDYIKLSQRATHYRQLAYRDPLTNCRNRIAYEKDIEDIDTSKNVTVFMADMNNMKEINDTYGHQIGDEVVILSSHCLLKSFGHSVYRIGGDEFVCIGYNLTQTEINYLLEAFNRECDMVNDTIPYKFCLSIGYATYDSIQDRTIHDTIKRADDMMYKVKEALKKSTVLPDSSTKKTTPSKRLKKKQERQAREEVPQSDK